MRMPAYRGPGQAQPGACELAARKSELYGLLVMHASRRCASGHPPGLRAREEQIRHCLDQALEVATT